MKTMAPLRSKKMQHQVGTNDCISCIVCNGPNDCNVSNGCSHYIVCNGYIGVKGSKGCSSFF